VETEPFGDHAGGPAGPAPAAPGAVPRRRRRLVVTVAVILGAGAGVGIGATALAAAATSPASTTASSGNTTTTVPGPGRGPARRGLAGGFLGGGLGGGPVVHGRYTVRGPNGYETIDERTGTVSALSNTSGNTWSLTVKSADGTSGTFVVNGSTSVNGGESGIASVKSGDTVNVIATVSGSTDTATRLLDATVLRANAGSWLPSRLGPSAPPMPGGAAPSGT